MSIKKMAEVWGLEVSAHWQQMLLALADHCDDDGYSCHPSANYLAWKTGKSERQVRAIMAKLREIQGLKLLRAAAWHRPNDYFLDLSVFPKKSPFREPFRDEISAGLKKPRDAETAGLKTVDKSVDTKTSDLKFSASDLKPSVLRPEVAISSKPSDEPSDEPSSSGAGAPGSVDKFEEWRMADGEGRIVKSPVRPPLEKGEREGFSVIHGCKPGRKLCADLRAPADQLFNSNPQRFHKLVKWIWLQLSRGHEEIDIIAALISLRGREENYGQLDDWWAYLEGANGSGQSMIERVRSRRLQGEASDYKKPGPVKIGDLAELAKLASAGK